MSSIDLHSERTFKGNTPPTASETGETVPLCVDLDGTLISSNLLGESIAILLVRQPWCAFALPFWLFSGRAALKDQIAKHVDISPSLLPYNESLLEWIRVEKASGRRILLATAADRVPAESIARHLGLFDEVLGSDGVENCKGATKLKQLRTRFDGAFDYAGNSRADLLIWQGCRHAVVVDASPWILRKARQRARVVQVFEHDRSWFKTWSQCLRVHQWTKNLLVFVPLITSHQLTAWPLLLRAALAFLSLSLCASGVYILNDIVDLQGDRLHRKKRGRPIASGSVSALTCLALAPLLMSAGFVIAAAFAAWRLVFVLIVYMAATTLYSYWVKRLVLLDVFCLAGLYSLRLLIGEAAYGIKISAWLLSFSFFLFLSLGFCKRVSELHNLNEQNAGCVPRRGYRASDLEQVNLFGIASGFVATVVLALYTKSAQVRSLYRHPELLWLLLPLALYWITRLWLLAGRGQMDEDPVLFAVKDRHTWAVGACAAIIMLIATRLWTP